MQTSVVYASSSPHPLYQHVYHAALAGPQDHALKKQYLALLPPQQIIEICLNFDLHVPPYVKSSVWPADINAAITAMRKTAQPTADPPVASTSSSAAAPVMGSLIDPSDSVSTANNAIEQPGEAQPPDRPTPTPDLSASAQSSTQPSPSPAERTTPAPPQQPPYPHQPYGYGHPQAAYPHAPYYPPPPGYPPYPSPYPYGTYPPGYPQQPGIPFTTAPPTHASHQSQDPFNPNLHASTEDLPSYEEMIAEALLDSNDPEGCAPKDMFTWMASRYPLQSNFRPSASQALQKAFKRGRFHKSSSGKYTINTAWEGGNSSRRPTRRPQTQNPTTAAPASPFTHAPLVHHQQQPTAAQGYQPGYGYPFQQVPQGYPGFVHQPQVPQASPHPQAAQPASTDAPAAAASSTDEPTCPSQTEGVAQDAWEAAQNILNAINLLQLPAEVETTGDQGKADAAVPPSLPVPAATGEASTSTATSSTDYYAGRAELQAHLALLAAQLAELSQEDEDDSIVPYPVVVGTTPPAAPPILASSVAADDTTPAMGNLGLPLPEAGDPTLTGQPHPSTVAALEEEEDSEDEDDMEEVI